MPASPWTPPVPDPSPDIGKSYSWSRRTNLTARDPPAGVEVVWVGALPARGGVRYWNQVTGFTAQYTAPLPSWVTGYGVRGLASPHSLGATPLAVDAEWFWRVRSSSWCTSWWATWSGIGFFRLLGGERGAWECRLLSGLPLTQRRAEQLRIVLQLWTSL